MGRPIGKKSARPSRQYSRDDKYEYVKLVLDGEISLSQLSRDNDVSVGLLSTWVKKYQEGGIEALANARKPRNPLTKYQRRKSLTPLEQLQYENMKLRIENERLKKGYTAEEVMAIRRRKSFKKNTKS
jgi:transposase-like protein